ncbi:MAG: tRNA pseudouridine(38-40) synthase TruA [Puniceicoccales bacterium]|jgi:tRNA pseudouridine38-40 synthase|nr:tRNA pseudouridine(38-40) synthase TruA [Puniceicoccales bacterium]
MQRWCGICAYDGTSFDGWQSQPSGNGIQDILGKRLSQIFQRKTVAIGSGRTDAGVHARCQVFHFDGDWPHEENALLQALSCGCRGAIRVHGVVQVLNTFHARFSAIGKRYSYAMERGFADPFNCRYRWSLGNGNVDTDAMAATAEIFLGTNDFANFANKNGCGGTIRTLHRSDLTVDGNLITYTTEGTGYLYRMVRRIVGAIVEVGRGKADANFLKKLLKNPSEPPNSHLQSAPAEGLFLERPFYGEEIDRLIFGGKE